MEQGLTQRKSWKDWWFDQVHRNTLIYNTCWEDPVADKAGLQITSDSRILMITSAGCNALSYLLDDPQDIDCIDLNSRQNALLELKQAVIRNGDQSILWHMFGEGVFPGIWPLYFEKLRPELSTPSRHFWDTHLYYYSGKGIRKTFYLHGAAGMLAFLFGKYLSLHPSLKKDLRRLFTLDDLEIQREMYLRLEPKLMRQWLRPLLESHLAMSLAGVPADQQQLATAGHRDGLFGYIRDSLRRVFTEIPARNNYFWRLYLEGSYTPDCCPEYLDGTYFDTLKDRIGRIQTHTDSITGHLNRTEKTYTHFILLDHQDWLAGKDPKALKEEWLAIREKAAPGARVLLRSAARTPEFLPAWVKEQGSRLEKLEKIMCARDRVGTYFSTWLIQLP